MSRKPFLAAILAVLTVAVVVVARPAFSATPVKIMPLGDSITGGPGCWRAYLWNRLQTTGFTNIDFVGSQQGGGCPGGFTYDGDNEGHGGFSAQGIVRDNQLPGWLSATNPDIVVMHLGTNDIWGNPQTSAVIAAFSTLVDQMRANNPNMKIIVAQIIPMAPSGCTWCPPGVSSLNSAIPGWAASKSTAQSPITVVDQFTGFDPVADTTGDGVHPNDSGFQKMANRWYPAVVQALGGTPPTTTATRTTTTTTRTTTTTTTTTTSRTTTTTTTSRSPTVTGGGACTATYTVTNQWQGGFQGDVTVRNTSTATGAWTLGWTFGNGQQITQVWNATLTQTGAAVTARGVDWNGRLAPSGTASFGFLANWSGANTVPAVTCTLQ